jgi:hypothetical protein
MASDLVTVKDYRGHSNIGTTYAMPTPTMKLSRAVDKLRNGDKIVAIVAREGRESCIM